MILDMHVHTVASDDSTATIVGYIDLILAYRQFHPFHGFVLTEHRTYTPGLELRHYWDDYGVRVLQGVEMDTNLGHLLGLGCAHDLHTDPALPLHRIYFSTGGDR